VVDLASAPAVVSAMDVDHLRVIRESVSAFIADCARRFDGPGRLLDVAPQVHEGAGPHFRQATIETLDIDPRAGATYQADLCAVNESLLPAGQFRFVVCTEVLEHVLEPFAAVREIRRILAPGGLAFVTTPYNFRIHGPLPDCWRFTEHGLRALFRAFEILELTAVATPGRDLMPIHYRLVARRAP
jgi:SAM-dependent methyltransferase